MNMIILEEWEPFTDYPLPVYVLYEGSPAVYIQGFEDTPIKIKVS